MAIFCNGQLVTRAMLIGKPPINRRLMQDLVGGDMNVQKALFCIARALAYNVSLKPQDLEQYPELRPIANSREVKTLWENE